MYCIRTAFKSLHRIDTACDVTVPVVRWARSGEEEESYVLRWSGVIGMRQASVVWRGIHKHPMFIGTVPVLCHEALKYGLQQTLFVFFVQDVVMDLGVCVFVHSDNLTPNQ